MQLFFQKSNENKNERIFFSNLNNNSNLKNKDYLIYFQNSKNYQLSPNYIKT